MTFSEGRKGFCTSANSGSLKQELTTRSRPSAYFPQKTTKTPFLADGPSWWNVAVLTVETFPVSSCSGGGETAGRGAGSPAERGSPESWPGPATCRPTSVGG